LGQLPADLLDGGHHQLRDAPFQTLEHGDMTLASGNRPARLVAVSNRVADPRQAAAGGLAVALGEALQSSGGLWFGWSGHITELSPDQGASNLQIKLEQAGNTQLATFDLCREDYEGYYLGYSNQVLWPVFHYRLDLAQFDASLVHVYQRVNRSMAQALLPLLKEDDIIWVHDYHLIPLAEELRALGCQQKIGFFLHIPLPPQQILAAIPAHEWLTRCLFSYDLVGLQTEMDVEHFRRYIVHEANGSVDPNDPACLDAYGRQTLVKAFPISVDVEEIQRMLHSVESRRALETMRRQYGERRLLVGVDRLDYSKGLPHRIRAFREMLLQHPVTHHSATLIQIAPPTREDVEAYSEIRRELESLCGAINGDHGDLDWMPVRYLHRTVSRARLPGIYRSARVGLVTPLRDGMNLVAKEYVAAQDAEDPGVLVLSRFAGAAEGLPEALHVNPYDIQGTADSFFRALTMSREERKERHTALLKRIETHDLTWWQQSFLSNLRARTRTNTVHR
jgi:trehalose 6-phosphate synthase